MPREAFSLAIRYNLKEHRSYLEIGNQLAKRKLIQHGLNWVLCPSLIGANPNKKSGSKICFAFADAVLLPSILADFPCFNQVSFFIRKAVIIDDTPTENCTEYASVDVLPFEEKTWSSCRFRLALSQIQCFLPPSLWRCSFIIFPQTCFVQLNNRTVTKLRTCRSCHLSYYLCTVAINGFFFTFLSYNLRWWISMDKSVTLPAKGTETNDRNRNLTIDIIYFLIVS